VLVISRYVATLWRGDWWAVWERSNIIWRFREEEVCSNRQSAIIWGRGDLAKSSYNFYSGWKSLIYSFLCSVYSICDGRELVKNVIWGEGSKIAQKAVIWYLNVPFAPWLERCVSIFYKALYWLLSIGQSNINYASIIYDHFLFNEATMFAFWI